MVIQGSFIFRVELVEANSNMPYKEHVKDGKTYVEVEPNAECILSAYRECKS
jgi:hypothetical protein